MFQSILPKIFFGLSFFISVNLSLSWDRALASDINENPLSGRAFLSKTMNETTPSAKWDLVIQLDLDSKFHAYADMFKLKVDSPANWQVSAIQLSPVEKFKDKFSGRIREGIFKTAKLKANISSPVPTTSAEQPDVVLDLTYQACSEEYCLLPKHLKLTAQWSNEAASGALGGSAESSQSGTFDIAEKLGQGLATALAFAFIWGFLTSFTPCIYPMIPITLSIIGARTFSHSKGEPIPTSKVQWKGFSLSVVYVLGIAMTYSALGLFAAKTGSLFGSALSNPMVVSFMALVFSVMGLSMFGLFEIQAPAFIRNRLSQTKTETGFLGAFVSGTIAGVVASPCVGPVIVGILTYVAQKQDMFLGFALLFSFAMGMGILFIVLGTFSGLAAAIPKAGNWMNLTKFVFGTTMFGMALYYIKPIVSYAVFTALVGLVLIVIATIHGAFATARKNPNTAPQLRARLQKSFFLGMFIAGASFIAQGVWIFSNPQAAGPQKSLGSTPAEIYESLGWKRYTAESFQKALVSGQPVIIDFWAEWCAACKELEEFTYRDGRVQSQSPLFQLFQFDATQETNEFLELQKRYKIVGLPTVLFFSPQGELMPNLTITGFENAENFLLKMKKARLEAP